MKFRVLRGNHSEGTYPSGHPWAGKSIVYEIGEIVDSASNLAKFNAAGPLGPKFQRIYDPNALATNKAAQGLAVAKQRKRLLSTMMATALMVLLNSRTMLFNLNCRRMVLKT